MTKTGIALLGICSLLVVGVAWSQPPTAAQGNGRAPLGSSPTLKATVRNATDVSATLVVETVYAPLAAKVAAPGATVVFESDDCLKLLKGTVNVGGSTKQIKTMCLLNHTEVEHAECWAHTGGCDSSKWKISRQGEGATATYVFLAD